MWQRTSLANLQLALKSGQYSILTDILRMAECLNVTETDIIHYWGQSICVPT